MGSPGQGLLAEAGLRSCGGDADSKHSLRDKLELVWLKRGPAPKRNGGNSLSLCGRLGMAVVLKPFMRVREGRRGTAILRLRRTSVRGPERMCQLN